MADDLTPEQRHWMEEHWDDLTEWFGDAPRRFWLEHVRRCYRVYNRCYAHSS